MNKILYKNLEYEKIQAGDTYEDLAKLTSHSKSTICHKMQGIIHWSIADIEILCKHYDKDYYYLFKKKEN